MHDTRRPVSIGYTADPGEQDTLTHEVQHDATVEKLVPRFYAGCETTVEVNIYVVSSGDATKLVETVGKDHLDGENDEWTFRPSEPVEKGDEIMIQFENTDSENPHRFRVNFELDREGGKMRSILSLLGVST